MELIALRLRARLWVNRPTIARDIASALQFLKTQRNVRGSLSDRLQIGASTRLRMDRILICSGYQMVETEGQKT